MQIINAKFSRNCWMFLQLTWTETLQLFLAWCRSWQPESMMLLIKVWKKSRASFCLGLKHCLTWMKEAWRRHSHETWYGLSFLITFLQFMSSVVGTNVVISVLYHLLKVPLNFLSHFYSTCNTVQLSYFLGLNLM